MSKNTLNLKDLGLSYEAAAHGVQSAIAFDLSNRPDSASPKHLRTGVDMSKADLLGLASLLIDKGIFTKEEYTEAMRLGANQELAMREEEASRLMGGQTPVQFR